MNCLEFQERMQQRLDGDVLSGGAEIEAHRAACATCRVLDAAARRLEQGLRLLPRPAVPQGLGSRVVFQALSERKARVRRRQLWVAAGALAASLLLALLVGRYAPRPTEPVPEPELVAQKKPEAAPEEVLPASLQQQMGEAGSALVALVSRTADETVGQGRLLLPESVPAPMMGSVDDWQPTFEPPALPLREAGQGVSAGLEPMAASARRAVNLFLREIPPMTVEENR